MKTKKQMRCDDSLRLLMEMGSAVFFTLTTPDEVDFEEIRRRWRTLRHDLMRDLRKRVKYEPKFVMNFERHPGYLQKVVRDSRTVEKVIHSDGRPHGWHIHGVINCRVDLRRYRAMLDRAGFGRVDVRRVTSAGVADYLTKHALKAYRGLSRLARSRMECQRMRLVNVSRGLPSLSSYAWNSVELERTRRIFADLTRDHPEDYGKTINPLRHWRLAETIALLRLSSLGDFQRLLERLEEEARRKQRECGNPPPGARDREAKAFADRFLIASSRNEDEQAEIEPPDEGQLPRPFAQLEFRFPTAIPKPRREVVFFTVFDEVNAVKGRATGRGRAGGWLKKSKKRNFGSEQF